MAKVTIADLDAAGALDGTELVEIEQGGESKQTTTQDIADLGGGGALTVSPQTDNFTADGASGTVYTNEGAAAAVTATLDPLTENGVKYVFLVMEAQDFSVVLPDGHTLYYYSSSGANDIGKGAAVGDGAWDMVSSENGSIIEITKVNNETWFGWVLGFAFND
jgi:hypothetical protein